MEKLRAFYIKASGIEDKVYKICEVIGAAAMATAFISIFVQVVYRYILCRFVNLPLAFTEELSRYCLFWIIYLLLPDIIKAGMEASNTFLPDRLEGKSKTALFIVVRTICVTVAVIAFISSFSTLKTYWHFKSAVMSLPGFFMYGPVVIGLGMVLIHYAIELCGFICGEVKPFASNGVGGAE